MPYILPDRRKRLEESLDNLYKNLDALPGGPKEGDLNYVITRIIVDHSTNTYASLNTAIGVLECAKLELYRRVVAEYENQKKIENGDAFKC